MTDQSIRCMQLCKGFYNRGLYFARSGELTKAVEALKYSLIFDKTLISARNLLGLIYYEIGEAGDAVMHWVISTNLKQDNNIASEYIYDLQQGDGGLGLYSDCVTKFNQSLNYIQTGNDDLALLQLIRVVESNPKYIKARLLLSYLYIKQRDYKKALPHVRRVLSQDRNNDMAMRFLASIGDGLRKKKKPDEQSPVYDEYRRMSVDDIVMPPTYKENTSMQTILYIAIGFVIGFAALIFIYMPTQRAKVISEYNDKIASIDSKLSDANTQIATLTEEKDKLTTESNELRQQLNTYLEDATYRLSQFQKLLGAVDAYRQDDYSKAADLFASIDSSEIQDVDDQSSVSAKSIYDNLSNIMSVEGYKLLAAQGDTAYDAGRYDTAISYYDKALVIKSDYVSCLYKKGMAYKKKGDLQTANQIFGEIIMEYPDTEWASNAKQERGY